MGPLEGLDSFMASLANPSSRQSCWQGLGLRGPQGCWAGVGWPTGSQLIGSLGIGSQPYVVLKPVARWGTLAGEALSTGGLECVSTKQGAGLDHQLCAPTGHTPTPHWPVPSGRKVWCVQWKGGPQATQGFCRGCAHPRRRGSCQSRLLGTLRGEARKGQGAPRQRAGWQFKS